MSVLCTCSYFSCMFSVWEWITLLQGLICVPVAGSFGGSILYSCSALCSEAPITCNTVHALQLLLDAVAPTCMNFCTLVLHIRTITRLPPPILYYTAATFVSFLLEVDSIYEVHDYIKSYLGETPEAHDFAKQFLEKRQKLKPPASQQSQVS